MAHFRHFLIAQAPEGVAVLGAIGLDEDQESAYRVLVGLGAAEAGDLSHRLGLPEEVTVRALRLLERQGLVAQSTASSAPSGRWVAAPRRSRWPHC